MDAISPLLSNTGDKTTFRGLMNQRPDVVGSETYPKSEVQSSTFGSDASGYGKKAVLADFKTMISNMVTAGFPEIEDYADAAFGYLDVDTD